jgi:hypothetical protein
MATLFQQQALEKLGATSAEDLRRIEDEKLAVQRAANVDK